MNFKNFYSQSLAMVLNLADPMDARGGATTTNSRKLLAANFAAGSPVRHVGSLPEVNRGPQRQMGFDSNNSNRSTTPGNSNSSCMINSVDASNKLRYELSEIPLFNHIILGNEPSIKPGTASAWVSVKHGGAQMSTSILLGLSDRIMITEYCSEGICSCQHYIGNCPAQLKPCYFASWFINHMNSLSEADAYVLHGVYYGFPIVDSTIVTPYFCDNYASITTGEGYQQMTTRIETELKQEKISETLKPVTCVHALGAIFKQNGTIRPITDCKRPLGKSINNAMSTSCYVFKYTNIDTVCEFLSRGDYLCVVDISNAYRSVNIFPSHVVFQSFTWITDGQRKVYLDHCLSFGLKSAPFIFTKVGDFIVKCLGFKNISNVVNYIDDFLICAQDLVTCQRYMDIFLHELSSFIFSCNKEKIIYPNTKVKYLGIIIDSVEMSLTLPIDKLQKVQDLIRDFSTKTVSSKVELQKLAGNLSHCATIIKAGKTFSRRVINIIKYFPANRRYTKLSDEFFADLKWWSAFANMFNGTGKIIKISPIDITMYTDASGLGFGGFVTNPDDYFFGTWDNRFINCCIHVEPAPIFDTVTGSISHRELWPILIMCKRLSWQLTGKHVCVFTDNQAVQNMLNSGRSKDIYTMSMLREIFWISFVFNFTLTSKYVKGVDNVKADYLSRIAGFKSSYLLTNDMFICMHSCCRKGILAKNP